MTPAEHAASSRRVGRAAWGTISREQIVDAAVRAVRTKGGYERMTIRSLAADLGVSPMALYRHVRDKDDLLDEVVDRLLVRAWQPRGDESDWKAWIAEAADKLRRFLVAQPAAMHVYLAHPVVSPAALARMEAIMTVLRGALGEEQTARRAYAAIHTYTIGFAALEASRTRGAQVTDSAEDEPSGADGSDLAHQLASYSTPRQFADGLSYLLEGIDRDSPDA